MPHFWVWLNEPQHSAAVQACAGMLGTGIALVAAYYAYRAYKATISQLAIAREQYQSAITPHLTIEIAPNAPIQRTGAIEVVEISVRNVGMGKAFEIDATHGVLALADTLPAGASFSTTLRLSNKHALGKRAQTCFLRYKSADGRRFRSDITVVGGRTLFRQEFHELKEGKEPPSFEDLFKRKDDDTAV